MRTDGAASTATPSGKDKTKQVCQRMIHLFLSVLYNSLFQRNIHFLTPHNRRGRICRIGIPVTFAHGKHFAFGIQ